MQAVLPNSQQPVPEESQEQQHRSTFLDLLLQTRLAGDELLSDDDIRGEVNTFMFAGHETVTSCLSFTLYYLSRYPDVQQRLYEEIETMARAPELTYGALMELKYTELVIRETLRLNPSVPMIGRMAAGDMEIDGVTIPTGTEVMLNIYVMQNDPQYYPDADQFRPERFLQEPPAYSYLPFSTGVRSCIGQRFAMLEMKTVLVRLLSRFRFVPLGVCDGSERVSFERLNIKYEKCSKISRNIFQSIRYHPEASILLPTRVQVGLPVHQSPSSSGRAG